MNMSRYVEKAIPPQAKLIAAGLASLVGCSGNGMGPEDERDDSWKPDSTGAAPLTKHPKGSQVCYLQGSTPQWITLLEDFDPKKQLSVLSQRADGKKFYATADYIIPEEECR
jgi:hypothetical protein